MVDSGGFIPVSIAVSDGLVYVLNAGGSGIVTTFRVDHEGRLIAVGSLDLGLANEESIPFDRVMAPGQVGIDALQRRLLVVNADGQEMLVAALDVDGIPEGPIGSTPTPGPVPFAFDTTPFGNILVAEASGSVTSYDPPPLDSNSLNVSAGAVSTTQAASCWIVVDDDGYAYVSNTASDTVSRFTYDRAGGLLLADSVAAAPVGAPIDMTLAAGGRFLYTLNAASGEIWGYAVNAGDGDLTLIETQSGLPASAGIQGIAARDD